MAQANFSNGSYQINTNASPSRGTRSNGNQLAQARGGASETIARAGVVKAQNEAIRSLKSVGVGTPDSSRQRPSLSLSSDARPSLTKAAGNQRSKPASLQDRWSAYSALRNKTNK